MKKVLVFAIITAFLASCSTSNNVVNNGFFQKRKYKKGWHVNSSSTVKKRKAAADTELYSVKSANTINNEIEASIQNTSARISQVEVFETNLESLALNNEGNIDKLSENKPTQNKYKEEVVQVLESPFTKNVISPVSLAKTKVDEYYQQEGTELDPLAVFAIIFLFIPILGWLMSVIMASISLSNHNPVVNSEASRNMALVALIIGIVLLMLTLLVGVYLLAAIAAV